MNSNVMKSFVEKLERENIKSLAVAGSQNFTDKDTIFSYLNFVVSNSKIETLIVGNAKGVDSLTREFAEVNGIKIISIEICKNDKGFAILFDKNEEIVKKADALIAFSIGKESPGTKLCLNKAKSLNKPFFHLNKLN